ncbi:hypothetical protein Holit_02641 [Hollandina sp. SP2]
MVGKKIQKAEAERASIPLRTRASRYNSVMVRSNRFKREATLRNISTAEPRLRPGFSAVIPFAGIHRLEKKGIRRSTSLTSELFLR